MPCGCRTSLLVPLFTALVLIALPAVSTARPAPVVENAASRFAAVATGSGLGRSPIPGLSEAFLNSGRDASTVRHRLTKFTVPSTAKNKKWFDVSVTVTPAYEGSGHPVTFYIQALTGGRWRNGNHKSVSGQNVGDTTVFSVRVKFTGRTPRRIRARFLHKNHPTLYTAYKRIRVK